MKVSLWLVPFALAASLAGCGDPPVPVMPSPSPVLPPPPPPAVQPATETPDAPFRQHAPAPDGKITFVAPKVVEATLKNGLRVLIVERHELPIVGLRLVVVSGAGDLEGARPGSLSFLGSMIEQGTKKRNALQISDDFEAIGAQHGAWFDWDSGGVSVKVLADKLDAALELMSDVALHPTFPDAELDRLRTRRITGIQAEKSNPGTVAQNALAPAIFGRAHPYGHSLGGEEADAKKLTRAELASAYDRLFVPKNAAIVTSTQISSTAHISTLRGGVEPAIWPEAIFCIRRRIRRNQIPSRSISPKTMNFAASQRSDTGQSADRLEAPAARNASISEARMTMSIFHTIRPSGSLPRK